MAASSTPAIPLQILNSSGAASVSSSPNAQHEADESSTSDATRLVFVSSSTNAPEHPPSTNVALATHPPTPSNIANNPAATQHWLLKFLLSTWLGNLIAGLGLILAIGALGLNAYSSAISVIFARWTSRNDALQSCMTAVQRNKFSSFCNATIAKGVTAPPLVRRSLPKASTKSSIASGDLKHVWINEQLDDFLHNALATFKSNSTRSIRVDSAHSNLAILLSTVAGVPIVALAIYLWRLRSNIHRQSNPFQSMARDLPETAKVFMMSSIVQHWTSTFVRDNMLQVEPTAAATHEELPESDLCGELDTPDGTWTGPKNLEYMEADGDYDSGPPLGIAAGEASDSDSEILYRVNLDPTGDLGATEADLSVHSGSADSSIYAPEEPSIFEDAVLPSRLVLRNDKEDIVRSRSAMSMRRNEIDISTHPPDITANSPREDHSFPPSQILEWNYRNDEVEAGVSTSPPNPVTPTPASGPRPGAKRSKLSKVWRSRPFSRGLKRVEQN